MSDLEYDDLPPDVKERIRGFQQVVPGGRRPRIFDWMREVASDVGDVVGQIPSELVELGGDVFSRIGGERDEPNDLTYDEVSPDVRERVEGFQEATSNFGIPSKSGEKVSREDASVEELLMNTLNNLPEEEWKLINEYVDANPSTTKELQQAAYNGDWRKFYEEFNALSQALGLSRDLGGR